MILIKVSQDGEVIAEYKSPVIPSKGEYVGNVFGIGQTIRGKVINVWHRFNGDEFSHVDVYLEVL
ncbi:hypothetical protein vBPpSSYP_64 [Pseudomonas phage vB_PpS_SYP]|nr:hypothetical protein vBPpSSYP_64 [Pseudomonas phage vB_PpS_SYP]